MADPSGYKHVGCYPDNDSRLLDGAYYTDGSLTIEKCVSYCSFNMGSGRFYSYVGVEDGKECWCGTSPTRNLAANEENPLTCNMACSGNVNETCGGNGYINIYSATTTPAGKTLLPTSTAQGATITIPLSTITVTARPTSTTSNAPIPSDQTPTVIALSVITGILALALLGICGLWFLRRRRREAIPQMEPPRFQDQYDQKSAVEAPSNNAISELVDTGVHHS